MQLQSAHCAAPSASSAQSAWRPPGERGIGPVNAPGVGPDEPAERDTGRLTLAPLLPQRWVSAGCAAVVPALSSLSSFVRPGFGARNRLAQWKRLLAGSAAAMATADYAADGNGSHSCVSAIMYRLFLPVSRFRGVGSKGLHSTMLDSFSAKKPKNSSSPSSGRRKHHQQMDEAKERIHS